MTSSRSYHHSYYNAEDERITAELRQRESDARTYAASQAALRGELGLVAQLHAMSAQYKALKAEGRDDEARAVKAAALALREQYAG